MRLLYVRQHQRDIPLSQLIQTLVAVMAQHGEMRVRLFTDKQSHVVVPHRNSPPTTTTHVYQMKEHHA